MKHITDGAVWGMEGKGKVMNDLKEDLAEFVALADKPLKEAQLTLAAKGLLLIDRLKNEVDVPDGVLDSLTQEGRKSALVLFILAIIAITVGQEINELQSHYRDGKCGEK